MMTYFDVVWVATWFCVSRSASHHLIVSITSASFPADWGFAWWRVILSVTFVFISCFSSIPVSLSHFYRASTCWQRDLGLPFLSVRPSVRHVLVLYLNECRICQTFLTASRDIILVFWVPSPVQNFKENPISEGYTYTGRENMRI